MILVEVFYYVYKMGFVYCDVKFGNIFIDDDDCLYFVDFGLVLKDENLGSGL